MKSPYRNALRSKQMIRSATIKLLNKKSITDISVTDIVKTANINRGTFYNHYDNPIAVLEEIKDELFAKLMDGLKESIEKRDVAEFLHIASEHFIKNEKEYRQIVRAIPRAFINDIKVEFIAKIKQMEIPLDDLTLSFLVNGICGMCLDYLDGKTDFTFEQISSKATELIYKNIPVLNWLHVSPTHHASLNYK